MSTNILNIKHKDRRSITMLILSADWNTLTPWSHQGEVQPYFSKKNEKTDNVDLTYFYIGPFALILAKWIGE